jgi:beta-lactamase regulating signal transducer with metallopeptidase domain
MSLVAALTPAIQTAVWGVLGVIAVLGVFAVVSPRNFAQLAHRGSSWVDTDKLVEKLDKRFDIDTPVLRYSRLLGFAVLAAVAVLGYLFWLRG